MSRVFSDDPDPSSTRVYVKYWASASLLERLVEPVTYRPSWWPPAVRAAIVANVAASALLIVAARRTRRRR